MDKKVYQINHRSACLAYLLSCKSSEMQYTGQTVNEFRHRTITEITKIWNNYKENNKKV